VEDSRDRAHIRKSNGAGLVLYAREIVKRRSSRIIRLFTSITGKGDFFYNVEWICAAVPFAKFVL
jgi:hypothetical protein